MYRPEQGSFHLNETKDVIVLKPKRYKVLGNSRSTLRKTHPYKLSSGFQFPICRDFFPNTLVEVDK